MSWIQTLSAAEATGALKTLYARVTGPDGHIDNILRVHSLRPHTLRGHMALYKNVLHHADNTVPKWMLETLGVYVSQLNGCGYCVAHHAAGLQRLLGDDNRFWAIQTALEAESWRLVFNEREQALLNYTKKLTLYPAQMQEDDVEALRGVGFTDGEILEVNQVVSYFSYANRTVLGLGVTIEGDVLGLSPGNAADPSDWQHG